MNNNNVPKLKVSPMSASFDLVNSNIKEGTLTITNDSDLSMEYKVYVEPYYVDENYNPIFTVDNNYTQLSHWISFEGNDGVFSPTYDAELAPGESKELKYKISMPEDAERYSQYAVVFVESKNSNIQNTAGVTVNSRAGVTFSGRTNTIKIISSDGSESTIKPAGEIGEINMNKFMLGGNVKVDTNVKNAETVALNAVAKVTIKNLFGAELYNVENVLEVMPETTRNIAVEWEATPIMGILNVDYTITAGDNVASSSQVVLKIPAVIIVVVFIVIVAAILSTARMMRNRKNTTGKYLGFKNNRGDRQLRRSRQSKIRLLKIRRPQNQQKDSDLQ